MIEPPPSQFNVVKKRPTAYLTAPARGQGLMVEFPRKHDYPESVLLFIDVGKGFSYSGKTMGKSRVKGGV